MRCRSSGSLSFEFLRGDVDREVALLEDPLGRVLVGRRDHLGLDAKLGGDALEQPLGLDRAGLGLGALLGDQPGVLPDRRAVAAPVEREGPARQALARVPLALAVVQEAAGREAVAQPADQLVGELALHRADSVGVPLGRLEVVDRHEGRLAAHRQPHVAGGQQLVHLAAEDVERRPGLLGEGPGDARVLGDAVDLHVEGEVDVGEARDPGDRRGVAEVRRRGERDVALAGQQARGRVEADPAGAGQVDLGPGVQVGEVVVGARGAVERHEVGLELDQVAGDEAGGETEVAQGLHEQPRGVAARAGAALEGLLGRLHPRLHADDVADLPRQPRIQADHEVDGAGAFARDGREKGLEIRADRLGLHVDREVVADVLGVVEGPVLGGILDEEVEGVVDRHVGDEVDLDLQLGDRLGKDEARQPVTVWILLVVHEVVGGRDLQGVREHAGARMRRGAEADDLRPEHHRAIVAVVGQVVDAGLDRHGSPGSCNAAQGQAFTDLPTAPPALLRCGRARRPSGGSARDDSDMVGFTHAQRMHNACTKHAPSRVRARRRSPGRRGACGSCGRAGGSSSRCSARRRR